MMGPLWRLWLSISIRLDSIYLRLFVPPRDRPPPIDIPTVFANFVEEYGGEVCDKVEEKSEGKIADYVFRKQNAIAELKCLETDPYYPPAGTNRLWTDLKKAGMSDQEIVDWARGAGSLSRDATWHLATVFRRRIEKIARKAEKQIEATRRSYSMPSARGLLLIANDNNYLFSYPQKFDLISDVFARHFEDSCISGFIFFTPNVPMRIPNSLREWHPWTTSYSGAADDDLVAFVDDLGHHWQRHFLSRESSRSPHFKSSDRRFMRRWMIGAKNVDVRRN